MTIKNQINKLKENWLLMVALILVVGFFSANNTINTAFSSYEKGFGGYGGNDAYAEDYAVTDSLMRIAPLYGSDFVPEVQDRKITKTTSLTSQVKHGDFHDTQTKLKSIITTSNSILINENVRKSGVRNSYLQGSYQIKVDTAMYPAVITQLKELGEVQFFNQDSRDITARYVDLTNDLAAEKARLVRFKDLLEKSTNINDQIQLTDRIFNIERSISYYEDSLKNVNNKVEYSTINFNLNEKQSDYANIVLTKFSELIRNLVESFNGLLSLIFWALPWAIAGLIIWFGVRFVKKRR